jgi:hypothetical protein
MCAAARLVGEQHAAERERGSCRLPWAEQLVEEEPAQDVVTTGWTSTVTDAVAGPSRPSAQAMSPCPPCVHGAEAEAREPPAGGERNQRLAEGGRPRGGTALR